MNAVAMRLKRIEKNMTLKDLSKKTGISYPSLSYYETGKVKPSAENLRKISIALDIPFEALLSVDKIGTLNVGDAHPPAESSDTTKLINIIESQQETIAKLVDRLSN